MHTRHVVRRAGGMRPRRRRRRHADRGSRSELRPGSQLVYQRGDGGVHACSQLLRYHGFVALGELQRRGMVARGGESADATRRVSAAQRFDVGERAPPARRQLVLPGRVRAPGESFECAHMAGRETRALALDPPLELWRIAQVESVEKGPAEHLCSRPGVATRQRLVEFVDVATDDVAIEAQGIHPGEHRLVDRAAKRIDQLVERVTGAGLGGLGPEECEQLVTASAALTRRRQHGQQRQAAAVMAVLTEHGVALRTRERKRAEGRQAMTTGSLLRLRADGHAANLPGSVLAGKKNRLSATSSPTSLG